MPRLLRRIDMRHRRHHPVAARLVVPVDKPLPQHVAEGADIRRTGKRITFSTVVFSAAAYPEYAHLLHRLQPEEKHFPEGFLVADVGQAFHAEEKDAEAVAGLLEGCEGFLYCFVACFR